MNLPAAGRLKRRTYSGEAKGDVTGLVSAALTGPGI